MKLLGPAIVLVVGSVLGAVAWVAKEPTSFGQTEVDPDQVPHALSGLMPAGAVVRAFDVDGICCDGCGGKLFAALDAVEGVHEIAVDPILKRVEVVVDEGVGVALLGETLTFGKYSALPTN